MIQHIIPNNISIILVIHTERDNNTSSIICTGNEQHHAGTSTGTATAYEALSSHDHADQYPHSHSHHAAVVHRGMDASGAAAGNTHIAMHMISRGMMLNNMTSAASAEDHYRMNVIMLMRR